MTSRSWLVLSIILALLLGAGGIASAKVSRFIDTESGAQNYERSVFGIVIQSFSEREFVECAVWENPDPAVNGRVLVSECSLITGCQIHNEKLHDNTWCNITRAGKRYARTSHLPLRGSLAALAAGVKWLNEYPSNSGIGAC